MYSSKQKWLQKLIREKNLGMVESDVSRAPSLKQNTENFKCIKICCVKRVLPVESVNFF
jgi:hypothetical protein